MFWKILETASSRLKLSAEKAFRCSMCNRIIVKKLRRTESSYIKKISKLIILCTRCRLRLPTPVCVQKRKVLPKKDSLLLKDPKIRAKEYEFLERFFLQYGVKMKEIEEYNEKKPMRFFIERLQSDFIKLESYGCNLDRITSQFHYQNSLIPGFTVLQYHLFLKDYVRFYRECVTRKCFVILEKTVLDFADKDEHPAGIITDAENWQEVHPSVNYVLQQTPTNQAKDDEEQQNKDAPDPDIQANLSPILDVYGSKTPLKEKPLEDSNEVRNVIPEVTICSSSAVVPASENIDVSDLCEKQRQKTLELHYSRNSKVAVLEPHLKDAFASFTL